MGRELVEQYPVARDTFNEADDLLGFSLSAICFDGPADELKRTSIAQPALVTISTAYLRILTARGFTCEIAAGHSLGEYSALVAAGALAFSDAVRLVRRRGELMEDAAAKHPGGMAAVIGLSDDDVRALCAEIAAEHGTLAPANFNSPGQVVVSGVAEAVAAVRAVAKARGARAIPLAVSGPFHSPLMQDAADAFAGELAAVEINTPAVPVIPNFTAEPTTDPSDIRTALERQITGPVQWVRTVYAMRNMGIQRFVEIGPGNVLTGLVQRTSPEAVTATVADILAE
jgi:[acyl-carrier-protein] S-malonyltransferase